MELGPRTNQCDHQKGGAVVYMQCCLAVVHSPTYFVTVFAVLQDGENLLAITPQPTPGKNQTGIPLDTLPPALRDILAPFDQVNASGTKDGIIHLDELATVSSFLSLVPFASVFLTLFSFGPVRCLASSTPPLCFSIFSSSGTRLATTGCCFHLWARISESFSSDIGKNYDQCPIDCMGVCMLDRRVPTLSYKVSVESSGDACKHSR